MNDLIHFDFIKEKLDQPIYSKGVVYVGNNLNDYITFEEANDYAKNFFKNRYKKETKDIARQEKSSNDAVLGRLVEEIIVFLLITYFEVNKLNYIVTRNKNDPFISSIYEKLKIKRIISGHEKLFDVDLFVYKLEDKKKIFCISCKGTTRERIGQFLSHLFLMDQDVLNAKYGIGRYEVIFTKENIKLKYAFVTFDWARNKDFLKYSSSGKKRKTVKSTEVNLILDDHKIGGGIFVLNNYENIDGIGNFAGLCGSICDFLK